MISKLFQTIHCDSSLLNILIFPSGIKSWCKTGCKPYWVDITGWTPRLFWFDFINIWSPLCFTILICTKISISRFHSRTKLTTSGFYLDNRVCWLNAPLHTMRYTLSILCLLKWYYNIYLKCYVCIAYHQNTKIHFWKTVKPLQNWIVFDSFSLYQFLNFRCLVQDDSWNFFDNFLTFFFAVSISVIFDNK